VSDQRLSAIMFTDIVDYTSKIRIDEAKMLRLLEVHNRMLREIFDRHEGEVVKGTGDGFLARFNSATSAVLAALEIQKDLTEYNRGKPDHDQIEVRIGVHLGDIVIREGDVFGDGVNVAARVRPLAVPGGICITRAIYDVVHKNMGQEVYPFGKKRLKGLDITGGSL